MDSSSSTPYHSAPSSPSLPSYYFSAPSSPMHYLCAVPAREEEEDDEEEEGGGGAASSPSSFEFEFSSRFPDLSSSAEDLFLNGQIRPLHPLEPSRGRDLRLRSRSVHRRARSMSPMRSSEWKPADADPKVETPSVSASSSRSSSTSSSASSVGRGSKRWIFLKDLLLYRSKSEGRANPKDRFWNPKDVPLFFSRKQQKEMAGSGEAAAKKKKGNAGGGGRRRKTRSAHERHYEEKRAEAEEMRKRTFLPYRAGLLGCLGFSSRSYGAVSGIARTWNAVGSR